MAVLFTITGVAAVPAPVGAKVAVNMVDCPGPKVIKRDSPVTEYPEPDTVNPEMSTVELPVLIKTKSWLSAVPRSTSPKSMLAGSN